ncbi:two-partner secretion domain-containing protein [Megamonas funiformis]
MKIRNKKLLTKSIAMAIFMSSTLYTMPITHAAFNNNTLPSGGSVVAGQVVINDPDKANIINQTSSNAVIQWKDFSIGANATVNFKGPENFNTLNYVNSGNLSQIYGTINADKGNIYIVNPAGVQIGNSAQINVGSLYVSNKNLDTPLENIDKKNPDINSILGNGTASPNAELMSLGNINATNVTFDGNRIVLDVDRVKNGQTQLGKDNIIIKTTQTDFDNKDVVLGYTAYDSGVNQTTYENKNDGTPLAKLEGVSGKTELTKKDGFMWIKDGEQLQAMNTNLSGNYAFRNSIDLNSTADKNVTFNSVGDSNNAFTGNLDGLGNEVYGLHINEKTDNTGLFGVVGSTDKKVIIRNFNLISGSISGTTDNVGAVVGNATNTVIENVKNTINVTGANNVGGIIGTGTNVTLNGVVNAGAIKGNSNVGGLAGSLVGDNGKQSFLTGESYNLGDIKGLDTTGTTTTYSSNIGGLVGSATNSIIGNETGFQMYNHLDVEGGYNVGGIVGNLENGSTVQNVSNDGNIKATRYIGDKYSYHTNNAIEANDNNVNLNIAGEAKKDVHISNVGGIVGKSDSRTDKNTIDNVLNNGDISAKLDTTTNSNMPYYTAGNVGGVVGSAVNTDISNATNKENDVRGAHNVGGIAGYFENGIITKAINNGGDIMATGARNENGFVTEFVRYDSRAGGNESFIVGNIGGIVGYMYGDSAYINTSANRGTVHTEDIVDEGNILDTSKAANVGGIVGKIDRSTTISMDNIKKPTNGQQNINMLLVIPIIQVM